MPKPMIMLEFNELSPALMDQFIAEGHLPNFARLRAESQVFVSEAEEIAPNLEPWIQWVTVHTGLSFQEHGIFDLGDGNKLTQPRIYELISKAGKKVLICGSMNAAFLEPVNGYILPDPWSTGISPFPTGEFEAFYEYVRRNVQEHSRDKMPVSKMDHLRFLTFMLRKGLSFQTIRAIFKQFSTERGGKFRWKRATILDRLQWDVFRHYWKTKKPDFSTFFINSTAHFQHMYWRNMNPTPFSLRPSSEEQNEYQDAVLYGYKSMDELVGECLKMAGSRATIVLATALGQQPCLTYEGKGGKTFYRAKEEKEFFTFAGITTPYHYAPVMSEQFHLYFKHAEDAVEANRLLSEMTVNGEKLMETRCTGNEVFGGCTIFHTMELKSEVIAASGKKKFFGELLYQAGGMKSGMHHPDGIFWVRDTAKKPQPSTRITLRQIAPTIASYFEIPRPGFMSQPAIANYGESVPAAEVHEKEPQPV